MFFYELKNRLKKEAELLEKHGWIFEENKIYNSETGCTFSIKDFAEEFIIEKYEELKSLDSEEDSIKINEKDFESFLSKYGYEIICKHPLEIIKNGKELNTGECAIFLKQSLLEEFEKTLK